MNSTGLDRNDWRAQEIAAGICPAEQLTERDIRVLEIDTPWPCSLDAGHSGDHEVWVTATFTDGRPDYRYCCRSWG